LLQSPCVTGERLRHARRILSQCNSPRVASRAAALTVPVSTAAFRAAARSFLIFYTAAAMLTRNQRVIPLSP
jgi:hypothetical protein